jgi:hypothetical protein
VKCLDREGEKSADSTLIRVRIIRAISACNPLGIRGVEHWVTGR